ncbi:MAG TPA: GNAT family N-acetyltransferase [Caulobacteraceae bacterium]|nr:GNAT family N-acetyltransferase [Caulobacteraceae bacterium]
MDVRLTLGATRRRAIERLVAEWGDPIRAHGQAYAIGDCHIYMAGDMAGVAAVSLRDKPIAELVAINAFLPRLGIGTALLAAITPALTGCDTLRLTTTNDNVDALRFYQRRGFRLHALRPGAVDEARRLKPDIPEVGDHGIPLRDEIDLVLRL